MGTSGRARPSRLDRPGTRRSLTRRVDRLIRGEPRLLEGTRLFNAGSYFASHEVWEALWHEVGGKEREVLQGLIQLAAAYHHLARGNPAGAGISTQEDGRIWPGGFLTMPGSRWVSCWRRWIGISPSSSRAGDPPVGPR